MAENSSQREAAIEQGEQMARDGAQIIDVGGESTRPGAEPISADEELRRVLPVIEKLRRDSFGIHFDRHLESRGRARRARGRRVASSTT